MGFIYLRFYVAFNTVQVGGTNKYATALGLTPRSIRMGSWKGRGNQYIEFVRVLYCKLMTNGKQLPAFPLEAVPGTEPRPQRREVRVLPLCHCIPLYGIGEN